MTRNRKDKIGKPDVTTKTSRGGSHITAGQAGLKSADAVVDAADSSGTVTTPSLDPAEKPDKSAASRVNMLEHWADDQGGSMTEAPQVVRFGANETVLVPFTADTVLVTLHYSEEPEIRGYVPCNGEGCVLCSIGRVAEERALLPVYMPTTRSVAVLAISSSARPGALRPQILPVLRSGKRVALLVRKPDRATFSVCTVDLRPGMDDGAVVIADFVQRWEAGKVDLTSVYPRIDNRDLAAIPGIAALLKFKRIDPDDDK